MDAHEKEMYRMELEVNRLNTVRTTEQQNRLNKVRSEFDQEIENAIQIEKSKNQETIHAALAGLRTNLEKEKTEMLEREGEKMKGKVKKNEKV